MELVEYKLSNLHFFPPRFQWPSAATLLSEHPMFQDLPKESFKEEVTPGSVCSAVTPRVLPTSRELCQPSTFPGTHSGVPPARPAHHWLGAVAGAEAREHQGPY